MLLMINSELHALPTAIINHFYIALEILIKCHTKLVDHGQNDEFLHPLEFLISENREKV
jgi:hypothetical protein